jgi:catechol 2,3-dioxygenase-like lactoylglutathione lyase family enzyme
MIDDPIAVVPLFRIFSPEKAREFYIDYLGFQVDWEHRFEPGMPLYQQISRGKLQIHLTEHHGDGTPGSVVFIRMNGLDDLHAELAAKNYGFLRPGLEVQPWKARSMTLIDPFGNQIRFQEDDAETRT